MSIQKYKTIKKFELAIKFEILCYEMFNIPAHYAYKSFYLRRDTTRQYFLNLIAEGVYTSNLFELRKAKGTH